MPPDANYAPQTAGITPELLANLRAQLRDSRSYHRKELIRRTLMRLAIIDLDERGHSRREIADMLNVAPKTIQKWKRRYQQGGLTVILNRLRTKHPGPRH